MAFLKSFNRIINHVIYCESNLNAIFLIVYSPKKFFSKVFNETFFSETDCIHLKMGNKWYH